MSVYTPMSADDVRHLLAQYDLGQYQSHKGISAGVENTNFFVETDRHSLVLTLFEKHGIDELPFYLSLGEFLFERHCKVPQPFRDNQGQFLTSAKNKPAVFIERLSGTHVRAEAAYAFEIGRAMADIHNATVQFHDQKPHSHGRNWIVQNAAQIAPQLNFDDQTLLARALDLVSSIPDSLPKGIIHADLFHDNALFEHGRITGIIDWYFAGYDDFALDIAIAMNDWCLNDEHLVDLSACEAFVEAYQQRRPLSDDELTNLPLLQIQSATRFWLSRWLAKQSAPVSEEVTVKDPEEMKALLIQLIGYTK